jgi:NhaP-type Na+/H+ or K+/H+ antiporter
MNDYRAIILAAALIFTYGLFSRLADRSPLTASVFFVGMGVLVGPLGLGLFHMEAKGEFVHILTEIALILMLFVDASTIDLEQLIQDRAIPIRMLFVGLPLTMALGAVVAYIMYPDANVWLLLLMALILSPTDAALGQAVVTSKAVPERVRRWILPRVIAIGSCSRCSK